MLEEIHKFLNNREIAIYLVFIFVIIWILRDKNTRASISDFLNAFFALKKPLVFMGIYINCIIIILYKVNFWRISLLKDTIYWIFGVALILFFNLNEIEKKENYFKGIIKDNLKVLVLVEFISNLKSFNLVIEIISVIIIFFFSIVSAYTEKDSTKIRENKLSQTILTIYGLSAFIFSVIEIIQDFDEFATINNLKSLLLSPIFTILFIPFMYLLGLFMVYETFFIRIKHIHRDKKKLSQFVVRQILWKCNFSLKKVNLMSKELKIALMNNKTEFKYAINEILTTGRQTINY